MKKGIWVYPSLLFRLLSQSSPYPIAFTTVSLPHYNRIITAKMWL